MTVTHHLRVHRSDEHLAREGQLAWRIAEIAADPVEVEPEVVDMIINRVIDNAAVAAASLTRAPVSAARQQALDHAVSVSGAGSTVFGCSIERRTSPEWAAWANGVAVRELDYHDTFLAADYSHPGDNIPPILAVAQHVGSDGRALVRGIATGYEIQIDLVRAICLHKHKIDHVAHLGPSAAAGIGTLLGLDTETIYQAVGQALHTTTATRQSRKGEISTWKAHAPAFAGQDGRRGGRPRDARRDLPVADLRGRGRRDRVDAGRAGCRLRGAASRGRRAQARHPRFVHEGALRRVPGAGVDRPRPQAAQREPRRLRPGEHRVDRPAHEPPHALRDRLGRERPAEVRPRAHPARRSTTRSRTSSRSRCRTARGTTSTRTRPSAPRGRTPSRCGTRSPPPRTTSGRAATTRKTRTRRPSAAGS